MRDFYHQQYVLDDSFGSRHVLSVHTRSPGASPEIQHGSTTKMSAVHYMRSVCFACLRSVHAPPFLKVTQQDIQSLKLSIQRVNVPGYNKQEGQCRKYIDRSVVRQKTSYTAHMSSLDPY